MKRATVDTIGKKPDSQEEQELPGRLRWISKSMCLSDHEAETLNFAAYQLEHLKKHLSTQEAHAKVARFTAQQKDMQANEAHSILSSDVLLAVLQRVSASDAQTAELVKAIANYRSRYGNAYGEASLF